MTMSKCWPIVLLLAVTGLVAGCSDDDGDGTGRVAFVPNSFAFWDNPQNWTTAYGPAYADILVTPSNFVPCKGGPIALCYYSGPEPTPCLPTGDGRFANCECVEIPYGAYFVDINAILNYDVYTDTIGACGSDGSGCTGEPNKAPVCGVINQGQLIPGADLISAFSFACVQEDGLGATLCGSAPYAGCMTAPCYRTNTPGVVTCQCPVYDGPFQVGTSGAQCNLPSPEIWSAAYTPGGGSTAPMPPSCIPDAPGDIGCPLLSPENVLPPETNCTTVCAEYAGCRTNQGVEIGYTCDATLCTSNCTDLDLVNEACSGLSDCSIAAIVKLEQAAECSCCASQLCDCEANAVTDTEIVRLNAAQAARGIDSQCVLNGTLCGN